MTGHGRTTGDGDAPAQAIQALSGFLNAHTLLDLASRFSETYADLARTSTKHFLVTPVTALPTGKEKGRFLSIDVGGTNLRVGLIELVGDIEDPSFDDREGHDSRNVFAKVKRIHDRNWPIEDHMKMDKAEDLFAWIGDCIAQVVREAIQVASASDVSDSLFGDEILLGVTFSFPMAQTSLSEATLLPMGKGFAITSDLNLGKMLLAGYAQHCAEDKNSEEERFPLPRIRVVAITNDTVATFASLAYAVKAKPDSRVAMGLIVGTGTNATVPMKLDSLHPTKRNGLPDPHASKMVVVNTEWTIRGTDKPLIDLSIKTPWDLTLDANSDAPGFQPFEYMTAGRYLGEIVRLVYLDIVPNDDGADIPTTLRVKNALPTRFLSEVVARLALEDVTKELEQYYPGSNSHIAYWTLERAELIRTIAYAVQQRSSALIAAACIGLLNCVGDIQIDRSSKHHQTANREPGHKNTPHTEELVIAYAGGTISQYPQWLETCQHWIDVLVKQCSEGSASKIVVLREALDGGIVGAGVLAGMSGEIN